MWFIFLLVWCPVISIDLKMSAFKKKTFTLEQKDKIIRPVVKVGRGENKTEIIK